MNSDVRRASQTQYVPQVGLPQRAPVHKASTVNNAPVGAMARATKDASFALKAQPIAAQNAMARYSTMETHAAGTCR